MACETEVPDIEDLADQIRVESEEARQLRDCESKQVLPKRTPTKKTKPIGYDIPGELIKLN
jgi:hypothetical protein